MSDQHTASSHGEMVDWVVSELDFLPLEETEEIRKALSLTRRTQISQIMEGAVSAYLKRVKGRPTDTQDNEVDSLAADIVRIIKQFVLLLEVARSQFYEFARLPKKMLEERGLSGYIEAAESSRDLALPYLDFLKDLQVNSERKGSSDPNLYTCIIASAGTGKTQLAATASLTYQEASTIYLNMGYGEAQRFYRPHIAKAKVFKKEVKKFLKELVGADPNQYTSAGEIESWAESNDEGNSLFVRILYHLLTEDKFPGKPAGSRMKLTDVKKAVQGKKFLVFLDEVPPKENDDFKCVICLRDTLRYIGISPILMSTHTGAQDYVGVTSRQTSSTWTWIMSSLPAHSPTQSPPPAILMDTERPLIQNFVKEIGKEKDLRHLVIEIRQKLQGRKPEAWLSSALQLVQLFTTDVEMKGETFSKAHQLVGNHFGSLQQKGADEDGKKPYKHLEATLFGKNLHVAAVCAKKEPLLYLALVTWDVEMLKNGSSVYFPLVDREGRALTVKEAFERCSGDFTSKVSTSNEKAEKLDGDLLEVLVHASLTLASMKVDLEGHGFLSGMNLKDFIPLVRRLMLPGYLDGLPLAPNLFDDLIGFDWPIVPALGSSNTGLPWQLTEDTGLGVGFLERPANRGGVDGLIHMQYDSAGNTPIPKPFISIECKNRVGGVDATELKKVFIRIKRGIQCALVFVSFLRENIFEETSLDTLKKCFSQHHQADSVTVMKWDKEIDAKPSFLEVGSSSSKLGRETFKAEAKTSLLVVIIAVDSVKDGPFIERKSKKQKTAI